MRCEAIVFAIFEVCLVAYAFSVVLTVLAIGSSCCVCDTITLVTCLSLSLPPLSPPSPSPHSIPMVSLPSQHTHGLPALTAYPWSPCPHSIPMVSLPSQHTHGLPALTAYMVSLPSQHTHGLPALTAYPWSPSPVCRC